MSLATYTDLQAAVAAYMARADLAANTPDFITQSEAIMNRVVRTPQMEASATASISTNYVTLPADFLEWISAQWVGTRTADLRFVEADAEEWRFRYRAGLDPTMFTVLANSLFIRPAAPGYVVLYYYQKIPTLVTNGTNWMMTNHPDIYLSLSLFFANVFVLNDQRAQEFFELAEDQMNKADMLSDSAKVALRGTIEADTTEKATARTPAAGAV